MSYLVQLDSVHLLFELQYVNSNLDYLDHELNELARDLIYKINYQKIKYQNKFYNIKSMISILLIYVL